MKQTENSQKKAAVKKTVVKISFSLTNVTQVYAGICLQIALYRFYTTLKLKMAIIMEINVKINAPIPHMYTGTLFSYPLPYFLSLFSYHMYRAINIKFKSKRL